MMPAPVQTMFSKLKTYFSKSSVAFDEMKSPEEAYDLWAAQYDTQPDNLVLAMEEELFTAFISRLNIRGSVIVDVGCGTGRHWNRILEGNPDLLLGFDVSQGMLEQLRLKFPKARVVQQMDHRLPGLDDQSCDFILSTLALAHMENIQEIFEEWNRVLKPGGEILITDYHPEALRLGSQRTFRHNGRLMAVESHAYPIHSIKKITSELGLEIDAYQEKFIDDSVRAFYQKQNALAIFERFKGLPLLHALLLKKYS
jgi:ubiquinone/menaquinone biosynthesis C-methylase UbiE